MTINNTGQAGYVEETTYGIRAVPTAFRRFGLEDKTGTWKISDEKITPRIQSISSKFNAHAVKFGDKTIEFTINYQLIDGKEFRYLDNTAIVSTDNTSAGDPDYKHTVKIAVPSSGYALESRTFHAELFDADGTFVEAIDIPGLITKQLKVSYVISDPLGVIIEETFIAQRKVTSGATTNLLGQSSGSTADPEGVEGQYVANRITNANKGPKPAQSVADTIPFSFRTGTGYATAPKVFKVSKSTTDAVNFGGTLQLNAGTPSTYGTVSSGGTDLTSFLRGFTITIKYDFEESRPNRPGTNNYGASIGDYLMNALVDAYSVGLSLVLDPDSSIFSVVELESLKSTVTKAIYIRIEKENDANDWIAFCFAPTSGTVNNIPIDMDAHLPISTMTHYYTLGWSCKDLVIIIGNAFSTLAALS